MDMTVGEIAALIGGAVQGDSATRITGLNGIRDAGPTELTFLADKHYERFLTASLAGAIIVPNGTPSNGKTVIAVSNPRLAVFAILKHLEAELAVVPPGVHPTAYVAPTATLGVGISLGPYSSVGDGTVLADGVNIHASAHIGRNCVIGRQAVIYQNVTIGDRVTVGNECIIQPGAVVGADGFGYTEQNGEQIRIPQVGTVILGDRVEVGANSCIDRATFGATIIGSGSKIDNLVQIGHNVQLGRNCIVCGNAGIAGSTVLGDNVTIGAAAGANGHIEIGTGAKVAANAGVTKSVAPGAIVSGFPAVDIATHRRKEASLRQLPDALKRIRSLEQRLAQLEGTLNGTPKDDR
ncbi:MAG: UDP-3-O-(3-hydroxymyristoyl)glucosamine N-acyltransferase [Candidatus Hydrogenedentes bacterium]|nr:UDP-3-O-(3-hydroxymyristoyl)glucosamine N-acyltransferase [Candidatus Hydrogenedentota bacterium]